METLKNRQLHLQMHHLGVRHIGHGTNQVLIRIFDKAKRKHRGTQKAYDMQMTCIDIVVIICIDIYI